MKILKIIIEEVKKFWLLNPWRYSLSQFMYSIRRWFTYWIIGHRYNIVMVKKLPSYTSTRLKYSDKMLYFMFQLLVDFMEEEKPDKFVDWTWNQEHREAWEELTYLYNWWIIRSNLPIIAAESYDDDTHHLRKLIRIRHFLWT